MNDNEYIASVVKDLLEQGIPLVLSTIIEQTGSAPRHIGTKMIVDKAGKSYGTIGGSLIEAAVIKESVTLHKNRNSRIIDFNLDNASVYSAGMICGGKAKVLMEYLGPTTDNLEFSRNWCNSISGHGLAALMAYEGENGTISSIEHCLLSLEGNVTGKCTLSRPDLEVVLHQMKAHPDFSVVSLGHRQVILDPIQNVKTLYCFGAGHVGKPIAQLANMVGFRVVVIDDRAEYANKERFPDAGEIRVIDDFGKAFEVLNIDSDSYIVIVTRGHTFDRIVLEQALKTKAAYIGMISSKKKRDAIYEALLQTGVTREQLARVNSPIGLDIGAETPEEIGISIAAELIQHRAHLQI